jgi:hypothetical protein
LQNYVGIMTKMVAIVADGRQLGAIPAISVWIRAGSASSARHAP